MTRKSSTSAGTWSLPYQQTGTTGDCSKVEFSTVVRILFCLIMAVSASSCSAAPKTTTGSYSDPTQKPYVINNQVYYPIPSAYGFTQRGIASWYGRDFHGRRTSNGESYDMHAMTGAHKTLPMHTVLLVKNLDNGREVVIRVNDRGPFVKGRIIDLSYAAARKIEMIGTGTARVSLVALGEAGTDRRRIQEMAKKFYTGEYYVQIGSFKNRAFAQRLQHRFREAGHTTFIQEYRRDSEVYHRVRVYVGRTLEGAQEAQRILERRGYLNAFVIAR